MHLIMASLKAKLLVTDFTEVAFASSSSVLYKPVFYRDDATIFTIYGPTTEYASACLRIWKENQQLNVKFKSCLRFFSR